MFQYYFKLGVRSLRRNPLLTALMVLTLAIGVAASVSTLAILHGMSGNPIPDKSERLLSPLVDNGARNTHTPGGKPADAQMSYRDAKNLLIGGQGVRRAALFGIGSAIEPGKPDLPVLPVEGIATGGDYFAMFEVPFLYGGAWSAADEKNKADVMVIGRKLSEKLFGKDNPVGRRIRIFEQQFQIVGVTDTWNPAPRYTHIINGNGGAFSGEDDIYLPFATAISHEVENHGSTSCNSEGGAGAGYQGKLDSECTWIQFWFETATVADVAPLRSYLEAYAIEQRKLGRLPRNEKPQLFDVMQWLDYLHIVSNDNKLAVWLSFGFLLLCLINTMGLLLAKFSARASEVGVRRALGATQAEIFKQFLTETAVIGIAGAVIGLLLSFGALWVISQQSRDLLVVAHMDWAMLTLTIVLAMAASLLAGILPTWRACQVTPALQLKSQ